MGVKNDGTVVAMGDKKYGHCDVADWTGIIHVSANGKHTVGLKSDGTVVATAVFDFESALAKWNLLIVGRPINWPLIGGIIAGVVAVVLVIFFVRRRRHA